MSKWDNDHFEYIEMAAYEIMADEEFEGDEPMTFDEAFAIARERLYSF